MGFFDGFASPGQAGLEDLEKRDSRPLGAPQNPGFFSIDRGQGVDLWPREWHSAADLLKGKASYSPHLGRPMSPSSSDRYRPDSAKASPGSAILRHQR